MQKVIFTILLVSFSLIEVMAQGNNNKNIFYSYNEFKNRSAKPNDARVKVYLNEFLGQNFITIKENGKKTKVSKDDLYGYSNENSVLTRIWKNAFYKLVEQGTIWIYYQERQLSGKGSQKPVREYYYSVNGESQIMPLTINNLKRTFPDNHFLHTLLDASFSGDQELSGYDSMENTYKINHLLTSIINIQNT